MAKMWRFKIVVLIAPLIPGLLSLLQQKTVVLIAPKNIVGYAISKKYKGQYLLNWLEMVTPVVTALTNREIPKESNK